MIVIEGLSKQYSGHLALDDVSLVIPDGAVTGLVGPNGAGKSTLLKIIAGVTHPTSGSVLVDGEAYSDAATPAGVLGTLLSAEWIPGNLTAANYLRYHCEVHGLPLRRAGEALHRAGLAGHEKQRVRSFSLGMRQRLGIAAVLMSETRNLLLDEPVNGLDPDGIIWLRHMVAEAARAGRSVLISSHLMSELAMVADHVVMLVDGRITRQGPLGSFVAAGARPSVYIESSDLAGALRAVAAGRLRYEHYRNGAVVYESSPEDVGRVVFASGGHLSHLGVLTRSLEETYFDAIGVVDGQQQEGAR